MAKQNRLRVLRRAGPGVAKAVKADGSVLRAERAGFSQPARDVGDAGFDGRRAVVAGASGSARSN